jgi:hypothetical protein
MDYLPFLIATILLIGLAVWRGKAMASFSPGGQTAPQPYVKRDYLFTKAERSFYEVLNRAAPNDLKLFAKVRIADLVTVREGFGRRRFLENKLKCRHLDFVLCASDTLAPMLAIQLEERSQIGEVTGKRDRFVSEVLASVGLPVLRIPIQYAYTASELRRMILDEMETHQALRTAAQLPKHNPEVYIHGNVNNAKSAVPSG